jgi:hypothetical protein
MSRDRNMNVIKASSLNHLNANSPLTNTHIQKHVNNNNNNSKNSNNLMNQISQLSRTNNNNEEDLAIKVNKKLKIRMLFTTKLNAFFTSFL